jgi:hypothetical protein
MLDTVCILCHSRFDNDPTTQFYHEICEFYLSSDGPKEIDVDIQLGYFSQSEDLSFNLESYKHNGNEGLIKAIESLKNQMLEVVENLEKFKKILQYHKNSKINLAIDKEKITLRADRELSLDIIDNELGFLETDPQIVYQLKPGL